MQTELFMHFIHPTHLGFIEDVISHLRDRIYLDSNHQLLNVC